MVCQWHLTISGKKKKSMIDQKQQQKLWKRKEDLESPFPWRKVFLASLNFSSSCSTFLLLLRFFFFCSAVLSKTSLKKKMLMEMSKHFWTLVKVVLKVFSHHFLAFLFCAKVLNVKYRLLLRRALKKPTHFSKSFHSPGNFSQLLCRVALKTSSFLNYLVFHTFFLQLLAHSKQEKKDVCGQHHPRKLFTKEISPIIKRARMIQLLEFSLELFLFSQIQKETAWQKWFWRMPVDHLRHKAFVTFHVPLL